MTEEKGRLACEARERIGMLMGVKELIFHCIGQEAQTRSERLEGGAEVMETGEVAVPALRVSFLPLISLSRKRYLDTSIHSDGALHFMVTASRRMKWTKTKQL